MKPSKCTICGYRHNGEEPPVKCPVCGAAGSKFKPVDNGQSANPQDDSGPSQVSAEAPQPSSSPARKWLCTVCGYIHEGPAPPDKCPVCGADKSKFVPVEEDKPEEKPSPDQKSQVPPSTGKASDHNIAADKYASVMALMTRYHAHPIAVHIPNGVLPLSVLFTLLAILFKSSSLALAAKYNMIFVFLAMPAVLLTGYVDWRNRFKQRMTKVFSTKIVCGGIVTVLSLVIALWWIVQPGIYLGGSAAVGLFLLLNLVNLAAAAVAGWYGGKLVFPKK